MHDQLVSICIPSYNQPELLRRLLDSIVVQTYPRIEVIISDDSPGEDIKNAISAYAGKLNINYFHHQPALKVPANWNFAMDKCKGELLMLVHRDDWFQEKDAIRLFTEALQKNPGLDFVFCRSTAFADDLSYKLLSYHRRILNNLRNRPVGLLLGNAIGPPSNVMMRASMMERYSMSYAWLVDVEFYIRVIKKGYRYFFIDLPLVGVGIHDQQSTVFIQQENKIIFKEHILIAATFAEKDFFYWRIFDLYWRLLRNYGVKGDKELRSHNIEPAYLPSVIRQIMNFQKRVPVSILKFGAFSKFFMWIALMTIKKRVPGNRV